VGKGIRGCERPRPLHYILAAATLFFCLFTGTLFHPHFSHFGVGEHLAALVRRPWNLVLGAPYALPLLFVLMIHEMGHFLAAGRWGVRVTWPFFIPGPPYISLGTFGAFIRIKEAIPNRRALLEIGVGGPLHGFAASLMATAFGFWILNLGYRAPVDMFGVNLNLPLGYWALRGLFTGNWAYSALFFENPILAAAWIGLFFQGLNLLPVGQLDGGHVTYAFMGKYHLYLSRGLVAVLLALSFWEPQWLIWVFLLAILGLRHPPCIDETRPSGGRHAGLGLWALVMFALSFHPIPFAL